jgi:hypothetical protein
MSWSTDPSGNLIWTPDGSRHLDAALQLAERENITGIRIDGQPFTQELVDRIYGGQRARAPIPQTVHVYSAEWDEPFDTEAKFRRVREELAAKYPDLDISWSGPFQSD